MKWYHYVAVFFAGAFLANVVPHFIHGVSGASALRLLLSRHRRVKDFLPHG